MYIIYIWGHSYEFIFRKKYVRNYFEVKDLLYKALYFKFYGQARKNISHSNVPHNFPIFSSGTFFYFQMKSIWILFGYKEWSKTIVSHMYFSPASCPHSIYWIINLIFSLKNNVGHIQWYKTHTGSIGGGGGGMRIQTWVDHFATWVMFPALPTKWNVLSIIS